MESLSREQIRQIDRRAIEELGVPGVVLMENAGRGAAEIILARLIGVDDPLAVILAGAGNNGGDGFVVARHLHLAGVRVRVYLAAEADRLSPDARVNQDIARGMGLDIQPLRGAADVQEAAAFWSRAHVLVDGLLGTGFYGQVRPPLTEIISAINESRPTTGGLVVALDVPSGLDCDTGRPGGVAVKADLTVTFVARKKGFDDPSSVAYTGEVFVVGIGAPAELN